MPSPSRQQWIIGLAATGLVIFVASIFVGGWHCARYCGPEPKPVVIVQPGIDAGPGDRIIDRRLDAAVQSADAALTNIDERYRDANVAFDDGQVQTAAWIADASQEEVTEWLRAWLASRRRDGGAVPLPRLPPRKATR